MDCGAQLDPIDGAGKVKLSLCLAKHYAMKTYWGGVDL